MGNHLRRAAVRKHRLCPPHPRDRHQALQYLSGPALSERAAGDRPDCTHFSGADCHNVRRRTPAPPEPRTRLPAR
eukprot:15451693-Alexandrium_andersonii.AAC.1